MNLGTTPDRHVWSDSWRRTFVRSVSGAAAAKGKSRAKEKTVKIAYNGQHTVSEIGDHWHPLQCSFHQKVREFVMHTENAGGEPKKRNNSVAVKVITSLKITAKRIFCMVYLVLKWYASCQNESTVSRRRTFSSRAREGRPPVRCCTTRRTKRSKPERSLTQAIRKLCRCHRSEHGVRSQGSLGIAQNRYVVRGTFTQAM